VLRGDRAGVAFAARFDVDLRQREAVPAGLMDQLRAEAHAAGYAAGWAQGRHAAQNAAETEAEAAAIRAQEAADQRAATVRQAIMALATAAAGLESRVVPVATDFEDTIVATAFSIAEAVLGRELRTATEPGAEALARVLALAPGVRPVTVRLCPADLATVTSTSGGTTEIDGRTITLIADPTLSPGDAVAECDATLIDARIAPAVERVRQILGQ
jgi:flagellar assembly protein FliH